MTTPTPPPSLLRSVATWCGAQGDYYRDGYTGHDAAFVLTGLADNLEAAAATRAADLEVALILSGFFDGDPDEYIGVVPALREHFTQAPADDVVDAEVQCGFALITGSSGRWECILPHGHDGIHRTPAPATIPADATGLAGKKARLVRRCRSIAEGVEVTIRTASPDEDGELECLTAHGVRAYIAASSLALIPDEPAGHVCDGTGCCEPASIPEPLPEPPVGTRLRDRFDKDWDRTARADVFGAAWAHVSQRITWDQLQALGPLHEVWERAEHVPDGVTVERGLNLARREPGGMLRYLLDNQETEGTGPYVAVEEFGADQ